MLAATAAAGQLDDKETEEKLKAAEAEKQALVNEQNKMKEEFEKWKEQYRQEHEGEEPSEENRFVIVGQCAKKFQSNSLVLDISSAVVFLFTGLL